ncbi:nitroreductase [Aquabacterium sp. J223]|uniref:nitroreductase n=1 Tax=Aquabacterium sp. J223 TaxID=2898431 RepID=UPI0021ADC424|nr:nitroreductase [Aquabacterium sp. J223]UUX94964.1 nitroreductase [Aquabacterium sp. J223]
MLERLLAERHSCRAFRPDPVARATIERLLSLAQRTASWCNTQPWHVHLVSGDRLDALRRDYVARQRGRSPAEAAPDLEFPLAYRGAYQDRRRACGFGLYASLGIGREDRDGAQRQNLENFRFFGAPHLAVVSTARDLGVYGAIDCGGYIATFLLAAQHLGLAAVAQAAVAVDSAFVRQSLGIADDRQVVAGISFGHEQTDHPANAFRVDRAPIEQAVTWVD